MRSFLLLLATWLLTLPARAAPLLADTAVLHVTRLPAAGLMLDKGWRYHLGDDSAWARPDFDDRAWDTLNPVRPWREQPARFYTGRSWLRLRFQLGDSLSRQVLLLWPNGNGAFELYLDGQLLRREGRSHPDLRQVESNPNTPPPLDLPALGRGPHVLAVRFAPMQYPAWLLGVRTSYPPLFCQLFTAPQFRRQDAVLAQRNTQFMVLAGVFGLLTLLHLVFFRYNPARPANRYFALYAGSTALFFGLRAYLQGDTDFSSNAQQIVAWVTNSWLQLLSYLWAVRALYALFGYRPGRLYYGLWVVSVLTLAGGSFYIFSTGPSNFAVVVCMGLAIVELLRLTIKAGRERQRGVGIVGTGFAVGLLCLVVGVALAVANIYRFQGYPIFVILLLLAFLVPALGISLFLAREFALDAQQLLAKLGEVEQLSAQTIAQEQEKQALLAAQNETLEQQVSERTGELQRSLTDLRATQAQLIQKEKMASLGELTAGIAHEIQNPLNFVNNFSEVSGELVAELKQELEGGDLAEAHALADDLAQNLAKITQHGRRAAGIVKGMLEHSSPSAGEREPTDLNRLCDEYLRLAYQGLRAKDKSFNAALTTDFLTDLPAVTMVSADVGRVLLNLFTNAFYAVRQRQLSGEPGYQPQVGVRTVLLNQQVQIQVTDNGTGMSPAVQAKIFQPFFTTKPTGEGTGLGLSLSHDIIAQGHGGTLSVESREGQSTTFYVSLPLKGEMHQPA
jgi:signal transduction histidine kinase